MAKRVPKKADEPTPDEPEVEETEEEFEEDEETEDKEDKEAEEPPAEIAVDFGDGVYKIMKAPGGVARALTVSIEGKVYQHVDEHEGRWAYRSLDPPS
jgi:hypothetical protein